MYNWNKRKIKEYIDYLNRLPHSVTSATIDLELLKLMKNNMMYKINSLDTKKDYDKVLEYDDIINIIRNKFMDDNIEPEMYEVIKSTKDYTINKLIYALNSIDKDLAKELLPFILNKNNISHVKNNPYFVIYLKYINKVYISLGKNNNITDITYAGHEFFHALGTKINPKFYFNIENEFFSILGELMISRELKHSITYHKEAHKAEINNYVSFLNYLKDLTRKIDLYKNNVIPNRSASIFNIASNVISYAIALELYMIYLEDKNECLRITNNLIKSNDPLEEKLDNNGIIIGKSKDEYVKRLIKKNTY